MAGQHVGRRLPRVGDVRRPEAALAPTDEDQVAGSLGGQPFDVRAGHRIGRATGGQADSRRRLADGPGVPGHRLVRLKQQVKVGKDMDLDCECRRRRPPSVDLGC